ncbi:hypothetical protein KFK09_002634 [Dendrobium nobile]|uniref:Uncharacterized protein n=1 Tax=Dendrobium nobile TaxID=94219 RepID=A0A8T3C475_DENNO|nr:hypothetical protein KFK09_002634 [Dendrobium nobile]
MCLTSSTAISSTVTSIENGSASSENPLFHKCPRLSLSSDIYFYFSDFSLSSKRLKSALKYTDRPGRSQHRPGTIRPKGSAWSPFRAIAWTIFSTVPIGLADVSNRPGRCMQKITWSKTGQNLELNFH